MSKTFAFLNQCPSVVEGAQAATGRMPFGITLARGKIGGASITSDIQSAFADEGGFVCQVGKAAADTLESLLLALHAEGFDLADPRFIHALEVAVNSCAENLEFISEPSMQTIDLNVFDDEGNVVDAAQAAMTIEQISDVVDHASQLIVVRRAGGDTSHIMDELEEALVAADVLSELPEQVQTN